MYAHLISSHTVISPTILFLKQNKFNLLICLPSTPKLAVEATSALQKKPFIDN